MQLRILASAATLTLLSACGGSPSATDANVPVWALDAPALDAPAPGVPEHGTPEHGTQEDAAEEKTSAEITADVTTSETELGEILTDGDGRTLYQFTVDEPGVSNCRGDCVVAWPPLLSDGVPQAAGAIDPMLLGTIERDDGSTQVTYDSWPLYVSVADEVPGDLNGLGVNDVWFVVAPDGTMIGIGGAEDAPALQPGPAEDDGPDS